MGDLLLISPEEALAVVLATIGMYVAMVALVRLLGQRVLSGMSGFDLAAVIAFGAIIGRASLGDPPRLASGIVALLTLVVLQALVGVLRTTRAGRRLVLTRPILLMAGADPIEEHLRRCHVTTDELFSRLRLSGIRHPDEVAAVIFEPSGAISVLRRGDTIDPRLLDGVQGAALVPGDLLR